MKRLRACTWRVASPCIALLSGVLLVYEQIPTSPRLITAAVRVVGARPVYRLLSDEDADWDRILAGVETGNPAWLRAAVALQPALDTHPGEEMMAAVSGVLEVDPPGALAILLPRYGPDVVCGGPWGDDPMTPAKARRRLDIILALPADAAMPAATDVCRRVAGNVLRATEAGQTVGW